MHEPHYTDVGALPNLRSDHLEQWGCFVSCLSA